MAREKRDTRGSVADLFRSANQTAKMEASKASTLAAQTASEQHLDVDVPDPAKRPAHIHTFNILDYIEASWGLGIKLYPVQRWIVKLYYNLPLDDTCKSITVTNMLKTKVLYTFTEVEFLAYMYNEGRCNIKALDHDRRELILSIGRRAGKTTLAGIFASYEIYRLLCIGNPQKYYGLPPNNRIQIISVATDKDQAGILFNEVSGHLNKCDYFKPYIASNTQTHINFRTPADIERNGESTRAAEGKFVTHNGRATLRVTFKSSIAKGLRGFGNAVIIMDEMAHFLDKGQGGAKEIYDSITPSAAAFSPKDPENSMESIGPVEARIILISSPLAKSGQFFDLFHNAMSGGDGSKNRLAIKAPTWLVNPTITPEYYAEKYAADPAVFMVEHGAEFSDSLRGWIDRPEDLYACIDPKLRPVEVGIPRYPYFMGLDVGLVGDGTVMVIGHVDGDKVVVDYHEKWKAREKWTDSNPHLLSPSTEYAEHLEQVERLDFDEIAEWIASMTKRFYIVAGMFDRWNGLPLEQALHKKGLTQFTSEFFTRDQTSKMYQASKSFILDRQVVLYDWPCDASVGRAAHSPLIRELLDLQAEQISKNLVVVAKSKVAGASDDTADALIRMVWLANEARLNRKHVAGNGQRAPGQARAGAVNATNYQVNRMRKHGVFTERLSPRSGLGGRLARMSRRLKLL